jgi:FlaA1/EpsC-like NDP-sugar epimerase
VHNLLTYKNILQKDARPIIFDESEIAYLRSQTILVTGAGGSIGSRICAGLNNVGGVNFIASDRDESALHSLSLSLSNQALFDTEAFYLLDIKNSKSVVEAFQKFQPTVVVHAAALKHLSILERQPMEALETNVYGTANVLEAASKLNVNTFVNISTDKAAAPASVLGRSKQLAEIYTNFFYAMKDRNFVSCRFGNVFASRGSVIETFASQMLSGKPVTVTDINNERFFMHEDEAALMSIKSLGLRGNGIFIFDMGDQIKLLDVVHRMQEVLETHSPIAITGLRSGEKLSETTLNDGEFLTRTSYKDIATTTLSSGISNSNILRQIEKRSTESLLKYIIGDA